MKCTVEVLRDLATKYPSMLMKDLIEKIKRGEING